MLLQGVNQKQEMTVSHVEKTITGFTMTPRLLLIFTFVLHFEALISIRRIRVYYRAGDDIMLPCILGSSYYSCSSVLWMYSKDLNTESEIKLENGNAKKSLSRNCSLVISDVTAEDAGLYTCWNGKDSRYNTYVYLNILKISPQDTDQRSEESVTLRCSLLGFSSLGPCKQNSLRWMDEAGTELLGEGDGYEFRGQMNCSSVLTVMHQRNRNRRYTCQFVQDNRVKIKAEYMLDFTEITSGETPTSSSATAAGHWWRFIYVPVGLTALSMIIVSVNMWTKTKGSKVHQENTVPSDEDDDVVNLENVGDLPASDSTDQ